MTERFEQLQKSSECLYTIGSPLVIAATALLKDTQTGGILAQVKFQNIGNQNIVAVFADFEAKDISGDVLKGVINFQFLDLNAKRNEYFGSKTAANIPDGRTRQIAINIKRVVFADNTAWDAPTNTIWAPIVMHPLAETFENVDLIEQYRRETIANAKYTPEEVLDLWICTCGAINRNIEDNCCVCNLHREKAFSMLDKSLLEEKLTSHNENLRQEKELLQAARKVEAERQKAAREAEAEKRHTEAVKRNKIIKKTGIIGTPIIIVALIVYILVFVPYINYNKAGRLLANDEYEAALSTYIKLGKYKDSQEMAKVVLYDKTIALMNKKGTDAALLDIKEALQGSSKQVATETIYNVALLLLYRDANEYAYQWFNTISTYKDAQKYLQLSAALSGEDDLLKTKQLKFLIANELKDFKPAEDIINSEPYKQISELSEYSGIYRSDFNFTLKEGGNTPAFIVIDGYDINAKYTYSDSQGNIVEKGIPLEFLGVNGNAFTFKFNGVTCSINFSSGKINITGSKNEYLCPNWSYTKIE